jgi:hypothetical protein
MPTSRRAECPSWEGTLCITIISAESRQDPKACALTNGIYVYWCIAEKPRASIQLVNIVCCLGTGKSPHDNGPANCEGVSLCSSNGGESYARVANTAPPGALRALTYLAQLVTTIWDATRSALRVRLT